MSTEQKPFQNNFFNELRDLHDVDSFEEGQSSPYIGKLDDRVLQAMSDSRIPSLPYAPLFVNPFTESLTAEKRIENTKQITEAQEELPFSFPEIIHQTGTDIETEYIPGQMLSEYIQEKPKEDVRELTYELGEKLDELHKEGWAVRDLNPYNIKIDETLGEEQIYLIDTEFATPNANPLDRFYDHATLYDGITNIENGHPDEAIEALQESYDISKTYKEAIKGATKLKELVKN